MATPTNTKELSEGAIPLYELRELAKRLGLPFVDRLEDPSPPRDLKRGDFDRIAGSWGRQFGCVPISGNELQVVPM